MDAGVSAGASPERDARGVWVSKDGMWEWDGSQWAPRVQDAARLGQLIGFNLKELEANRAGRLTPGQAVGLWMWASIWLLLGLGVFAIVLAIVPLWNSFLGRVFVAPTAFLIAVYLCWRAVAAVGDALGGGVAKSTSLLTKRWEPDDDIPSAPGYYYVSVGGVEKKLYRSAGEAVPEGIICDAYYSPESKRLLSLEPVSAVEDPAISVFVPPGKAPTRIRWRGIAAVVGIFMLSTGAGYVLLSHPARLIDTYVAGVLLILVGGCLLLTGLWHLVRRSEKNR